MVTKQTISDFFEGRCSAEEAIAVKALLEENPDLLNEYFGEAEWDAFQPEQTLASETGLKLWQKVDKKTRSVSYTLYIRRMAVAASILLVLGLSWIIFNKTRSAKVITEAGIKTRDIFNNTAEKMVLRLSDSSIVELMPNSLLSYPENFDAVKRDVAVKGEANFIVSKETGRPFSVHSDAILTTVLGTSFTVNSYASDSQIKVILHNGKVSVKPTGQPFHGNKSEYILQPGDVFVFNKTTRQVNVTNPHIPASDNNSISGKAGMKGNNWYMFNNQPLSEVLDQLQVIFNTPINYSKADIQGMTFIGKIDRTDSLENILNTITLLNNLRLQKDNKGYTIRK